MDRKPEEFKAACGIVGELIGELVLSWLGQGGASTRKPKPAVEGPVDLSDTVTRKEAAALLKVAVGTIDNMEDRSVIRRIKGLGPRTVRFARAEIEKLNKRKRE